RMMHLEAPKDVLVVLVSYLPVPNSIGEMKTKPTQYAVRTLNGVGLQPNMIICRSTHTIDAPRKRKLSVNCNVATEDVIAAPDVGSIYEVPAFFRKEHVDERIVMKLGLRTRPPRMKPWKDLLTRIGKSRKLVRIGVVGKYFSTGDFVLTDSYLSVLEAIKHAAWFVGRKPEIVWLNSEDFESRPATLAKTLRSLDGVIIPGGFGTRGIEGKLAAIKYVREKSIPYLGLCYGMQLATVEAARNLLGWKDANTTEIAPKTKHPVIHLMDEQEGKMKDKDYGGTMRLGSYPCVLKKGSLAHRLYGRVTISERHRHRYEANPIFREELEKAGLVVSGVSPDGKLAEIVEIQKHPFFVASQFHPEFLTRPFHPHPLFLGFMKAAVKRGRR
ncbi:CTP synthase, partial [Patescibacteria group bacterium]|nr:CTP synthase [Patescibacteria group bacterium]MBU1448630.1 CTP synthase [Patescibacteria group bacterium]